MIEIEERDNERAIVTPNCRLIFRQDGERWTHRIESARSHVRILESVESDPENDPPLEVVSPSFQDLHFQDSREGLVLAMLVGQSGPCHFSAVFRVEMVPQGIVREAGLHPGGSCKIEVDVAVRSRAMYRRLASTYTLFSRENSLEKMGQEFAAWEYADGAACVGSGFRHENAGALGVSIPAASLEVADLGEGRYQACIKGGFRVGEMTQRYGYLLAVSAFKPNSSRE